jgi:magnesium transporter
MRNSGHIKKQSKSAGLPPGTLIHIGEQKLQAPRITVIDYDEQSFKEKQVAQIEECFEFKASPTVTWINIDGIHDTKTIEKIGSHYDLHQLTLEDILTTGQRPKFEDLEKHLFIVLNMLSFSEEKQQIQAEQVSIILGPNFVISFQESIGDVFEPIRDRIRNAKGRIRKMGCDYLMYSLMDAVVDNYFVILEKLGEKIESLEEELVSSANEQILKRIYRLKREMIFLRRSVWPLRELIGGIERSESELINDSTNVYLRDLYDHTIQVIDTVESYRDMVSGMLDIYLSAISNRMNAVMKVLTIIATIFIPLTFIVGVYGMNFKFMPELQWKWGYGVIWLVIIIIAAVMLIYFKRKKWL